MKELIITNPVIASTAALLLCLGAAAGILAAAGSVLYIRSRNFAKGEFKRLLLKKRPLRQRALLAALAFSILFSAAYQGRAVSCASVIITLNYAEASRGENANGTRYNMSELICREVLERAIAKGAFEGVTAGELRECLEVEPLIQGNAYQETEYHIATEFRVSYRASWKTAYLDAETVVQLIAEAYKEFCIDKYAYNLSALDLDPDLESEMRDMDYLDAVAYLQKQIYRIENYMYGLINESPGFSSLRGETFQSIVTKTRSLDEVQIENGLKSYILHNGTSRDVEAYIERLRYENNLLDYDRQRATASFEVRNQAVDMYAEEMTRIVLIPTWDVDGKYYMGQTKVGIDNLSVEAEAYSQSAAGYLEQIEANRQVIAAMSGAASSGSDATAERLISEISGILRGYAASAKAAAQEYSEARMNRCISAAVHGAPVPVLLLVWAGSCLFMYAALSLLAAARELPAGVLEERRAPGTREEATGPAKAAALAQETDLPDRSGILRAV